MIKPTKTQIMASLTTLFFAFILIAPLIVDESEARSRGGGRSFNRSRSYSKTPPKSTQAYPKQNMNNPRRGSSFMRGLGGGLLGGFLGSMLFGGVSHGMGAGGFGGSGIGLLEILIFGGLIYFVFKKFSRRPNPSREGPSYSSSQGLASDQDRSWGSLDTRGMAFSDPVPEGIETIRASDPGFDTEEFKEFAQDVFFKVQAAWTRRDIAVMAQYLGRDLLSEYKAHFDALKEKGEINRLENIAVRKVEILDLGEMDGEEFVVVRFTANLLDYTVDESSGKVLKGDPTEPVKFEEKWAFARAKSASQWKLEGIQD